MSIPPLSWLYSIDDRRLVAGASVKTLGNRVHEGVADSENFMDAENFFGSGLEVGDDAVTVATATHPLEFLYTYRGTVSNSFSFLLEYCNLEMNPSTSDIVQTATSVLKGTADCENELRLNERDIVTRLVCCNATITRAAIDRSPKVQTPRFGDFADYKGYLLDTLARIQINEPSYALMTTVSRGYDSATCAALARDLGCKDSITLREARGGNVDSGAEIAGALGMRCIELERPLNSSRPGMYDDCEFIASHNPEDSVFQAFEKEVGRKILLVGHHGDIIWDRHEMPSDDFKRQERTGLGLHEFRLRKDLIIVPVPFVGAQRHDDIRTISNADEMKPYQVGGTYDRPIARRIVEEAGVDRSLFGQTKQAVNITMFEIEDGISPDARREVDATLTAIELSRERSTRAQLATIQTLRKIPIVRRVVKAVYRRWFQSRMGNRRYYEHLFCWSVGVIRKRYR